MVAVLLVASGCGGTTEGAAAGSDADAGGEAPAGDRLAESTFDVEAVTVDGEPFDLAQLAASDVVLWFWAPW